jgi:hypothetical protein
LQLNNPTSTKKMNTKKMTMKPQGHHGLQTNGRNMKSLNTTLSALALKSALTATVLALLVAASPAQGTGRNPNPGVIPPGSTYRGQSYGEWGAQWWKTIFSIPIVDGYHPLISGGAFEGEKGVVFLAAAAGGVTIDVTIRPGASLFVPVLNSECSVIEPDPFHGDDEAEMRACANGHIDHTSGLIAVIDGVPVQNLTAYRVESPLFEFGPLPADNVLGAPAGTTSLAVDAGIYLMLTPLSPGSHTIHVRGTFDEFAFTIDTTFNITVE